MAITNSSRCTSLVLDGLLVAGSGAAAACFAVIAVIWGSVDAALVDRADNAGWDTSLLLPHQNVLWLVINGGLVLTVLVFLLAVVSLGLKITRTHAHGTATTTPEHRRILPTPVGDNNSA